MLQIWVDTKPSLLDNFVIIFEVNGIIFKNSSLNFEISNSAILLASEVLNLLGHLLEGAPLSTFQEHNLALPFYNLDLD